MKHETENRVAKVPEGGGGEDLETYHGNGGQLFRYADSFPV